VLRTGQFLTGKAAKRKDFESPRASAVKNCPLSSTEIGQLPMTNPKFQRRSPSFDEAIDIWLRLLAGEFQHDIAAFYGYNQGRIADVKAGRLHPNARLIALEMHRNLKAS
jgi:hypothetical protein